MRAAGSGARRTAFAVGAAAVVVVLLAAILTWRQHRDDAQSVAAGAPAPGGSVATTTGSTPATGAPEASTSTTETSGAPEPSTTFPPPAPTTARPVTTPTTPAPTAPPTTARPAPRVAVVGDSTAELLAPAVAAWGNWTGRLVGVGSGARLGCPLGRGGDLHTAADAIGPVSPLCDWAGSGSASRPSYPDLVAGWRPDVVVVEFGVWDTGDRLLPGDSMWRAVGDPVVDAWLLDEMTAATDILASGGATVVWLTQPPWEGATRHPPATLYAPAADPARMQRYNALLRQLAARRPGSVTVVDLAGWIAGTGEDARFRPDGAHFAPEAAFEVMDRFLGEQLLRAAG